MLKSMVAIVVVSGAIGVGAYMASPGMRAKIHQGWTSVGGWNEDARRADPVGFADHAKKQLAKDLETLQKTRRELAAEIGQLVNKLREQEALANQAQQLAEEFRAKYQEAKADGKFPIQVRNAAYTEEQAKSQLSMVLAESEGYQKAVSKLRMVKQEAENQLEQLTVKLNATEVKIAALGVKREELRAGKLSTEDEQLLAQVDELLTGNQQVIEGSPVRTVRELLAAPSGAKVEPTNLQKVEEFLAAKPIKAQKPSAASPRNTVKPVSAVQSQVPPADPVKTEATIATGKPEKETKPIFQQF